MTFRTVGIALVWTAACLVASISAYGWWFHYAVGPSHGAGMEIGIVAGVLGLALFSIAAWLGRRRT